MFGRSSFLEEYATRGFHSATLSLEGYERTADPELKTWVSRNEERRTEIPI